MVDKKITNVKKPTFSRKDLAKLDLQTLEQYSEQTGVSISKQDYLKCKKHGEKGLRLLFYKMLNFPKEKKEQQIELETLPDKPIITLINDEKKVKLKQKVNVEPETFFEHNKRGNPTKFIPKLLGDFIMEEHHFKTIKGNDKQIYIYVGGCYKENGGAAIKEITTNHLGDFYKEYYVNEVISYIRNNTYIESKEINHGWINFQNGLFNPIIKEFKKHTPEIFCLNQLPINYIPKATCPLWVKKLNEKCDENWKYNLIQEMFGYCFLSDNRFEKAFLFYGDPQTMKSTILYILASLLGEGNSTAFSLQQLTEDRHAPAFLFGTSANICADLSSKELKNTAMFLKIVGQDNITAGKKFEQEITFSPYTKLIFSCNIIPGTLNKNLAFYRRWGMLELNVQTKPKEIDVLLRQKLLEELSGIFNWGMVGLDRLLKNKELSYPFTAEKTKDLYEKWSDSIQSFIYNKIDCENDEGTIKKRDVYKKYQEYCKKNKLHLENHIIFGRRFFAITGCGSKRIGVIPSYAGVAFLEEVNKIKQEKITEK